MTSYSQSESIPSVRRLARLAPACLLAAVLLATPLIGNAQRQEPAPKDLEGVGVDEHLVVQIPLDLAFRDERGNDLVLGEFFSGQRPVILSMNYSDCPMLCTLQLNGLIDALREISLNAGEDYDVVSVSIDPQETPQRAYLTKQKYVRAYGRPGSASGWHFLTGSQANITKLATTVGFRYRYVRERKEYAHAAVVMLCAPDGKLSRYLYGVHFPPRTVQLSLVEASEGKMGSTLDRVLLYCFHYDATAGRYGPVARNIMKLGAGLTLGMVLVGLLPVWLRRNSRTRSAALANTPAIEEEKSEMTEGSKMLSGLAVLGAPGGSLFFPRQGSTFAEGVDDVFYFILIICIIFFALIVGLMGLFVFRYRQRDGHDPLKSPAHNNALEVSWSVIPSLIVAVMFVWGFYSYMDMRQAPDNSYEIQVKAKKWAWQFTYPNGYVDNQLHVPMDRPVRLVMSSDDVIHSLFVPAFRIKMDVVPGRYSTVWFQATEVGDHDLFCAEYCGTQHSQMISKVIVHGSGEFEPWLEDAANFLDRMTPAEGGEILYVRRGCVQCHSVDGLAKTGPTFKGSFGAQHTMTDGTVVTVDENYIRESILEPQAKIRQGFKPVMPTYKGQLRDQEIDALIAYIKTLK